MQLGYYDYLTPKDYEPPGFIPSVFDINCLFEAPTFKYDFGLASSAFHRYKIQEYLLLII